MQFTRIFLFTLAATATGPSVALAQSLAGATAEAAAQDYQDALRLFEAGEYRRALRPFQSAYDAVPNAESLYGMGRCHEELGNHARAVEVYDRLLQEYPAYSDRASVEQALAELRAQNTEIEEADDVSRGDVVGAGGWVHEKSRPDVHLQEARMSRIRKISWGILASGLAVTAVGAGLLIRGAVLHREFEQATSNFFASNEVGRESIHNDLVGMAETGESFFGAGWGLTISGLAIACTSALLLLFVPGEMLVPRGAGSRANVHLSLAGTSFVGSF